MSTSAIKCASHCYHSTGVVQTVHPPRYGETCCHCGHTRYVASKLWVDDTHGPYVPPVYTLKAEPVTVSISQPVTLTLGDPLLDVFFGKTTHVLPTPAEVMPACKQEAKARGFSPLPAACSICKSANTCPAGKP